MSPPTTAIPETDRRIGATVAPRAFRAAIVVPRFAHDPRWPWLTAIPPLDASTFDFMRIRNVFRPLPAATGLYRRLQHARAARRIASAEIAFLFSVDIAVAVASARRSARGGPKLVYVGFTQDGHWEPARVDRVGAALRAIDAVTVFTEAERRLYVERYAVEPERLHVLPIHTDEVDEYRDCQDAPPHRGPFAVGLGVTNRVFAPTARACRALGVPLVILTRPHHRHDDLEELARLGATVITDADQVTAWRYVRHARLAVVQFAAEDQPCGFTTVINAAFLGTPVVAGASVGMDEHVVHGESGLIVPRGDDTALRESIDRLWNDAPFAARIAAAARARAAERHSLESAAPRFHRLACDLL